MTMSSLIIVAVAIVLMGGGGVDLFTDTIQYRTFFPEANGLKAGSEVWLAGVEVGQVRAVAFSDPNDIEALEAIEVVLEVDETVSPRIRKDSVASLRTIGLLGDKYVEIRSGTPDAPVTPRDGIIQGISLSTFDELVGVGRSTARGFNELMIDLRTLVETINEGEGSMGKLVHDADLYKNLNTTLTQTNRLLQTAQQGSGTLGRAMTDPALYNNLVTASASTRRVIASLDSTLRSANVLLAQMQQGEGTVGKLTTDPALYNQMVTTLNRLDNLAQSVERGEGSLGRLVQQDTLVQEMEGLVLDLRTLVRDLQANPKKYFKVSVF
jgi:phospholipid/cholesterol/gamma-HCH transport system substrate-binding protein